MKESRGVLCQRCGRGEGETTPSPKESQGQETLTGPEAVVGCPASGGKAFLVQSGLVYAEGVGTVSAICAATGISADDSVQTHFTLSTALQPPFIPGTPWPDPPSHLPPLVVLCWTKMTVVYLQGFSFQGPGVKPGNISQSSNHAENLIMLPP